MNLKIRYLLACVDYFCMLIAYLIVVDVFNVVGQSKGLLEGILEFATYALFSFLWGFIMQLNNLYKIHILLTRSRQIVLVVRSCFFALIAYSIISFFIRPRPWIESRLTLMQLFPLATFFLLVWRLFIFRYLWSKNKKDHENRYRTAIIGSGFLSQRVAAQLEEQEEFGLQVIGFLDGVSKIGKKIYKNYSIIGSWKDFQELVETQSIEHVIIADEMITPEDIFTLSETCTPRGIHVHVASDVYDIVTKKLNVDWLSSIPIVPLTGAYTNKAMMAMKRAGDLAVVIPSLFVMSPFLLLIAILIKLSSKGPVIYRQKRIGKNGKEFEFYKFRSMYTQGEETDETFRTEQYEKFIFGKRKPSKIIDNTRVSRFGAFLRKTSIDEIPQLWNVVKGDMTLVGPRPSLPYEYNLYTEWQKKRLAILPGCTGLWQVSGRLDVTFTDMVLLDFYYIENLSPWLDLQIILKTIPVMLFARGGK